MAGMDESLNGFGPMGIPDYQPGPNIMLGGKQQMYETIRRCAAANKGPGLNWADLNLIAGRAARNVWAKHGDA